MKTKLQTGRERKRSKLNRVMARPLRNCIGIALPYVEASIDILLAEG